MENEFKVGQTVYIQGVWKAKVRAIHEGSIVCDVYEGLAHGEKVPGRYSYAPSLLEKDKK